MPFYFPVGDLGGCGGNGGRGVGCGTTGGFFKPSSNCPNPAAIPVAAINIIRTKQMRLI
jgi:hypothetical protein